MMISPVFDNIPTSFQRFFACGALENITRTSKKIVKILIVLGVINFDDQTAGVSFVNAHL